MRRHSLFVVTVLIVSYHIIQSAEAYGNFNDSLCPYMAKWETEAALQIWNYMKMGHRVQKSDLILALGSYDIRVAEYAAQLWLDGFGKMLMFSGKGGKLTRGMWGKSEAETFKDMAISKGVPEEYIIIETRSCNTGENIRFSFQVLKRINMVPDKIILVQKPYMERRTFATFRKQWPGDLQSVSVFVISPNLDFFDYPNDATGSLRDVITVMVGDFQRIVEYEKLGFQISQEIPENINTAYLKLKATGKYNNHMT